MPVLEIQNYINGSFVSTSEYIDSFNPATDEINAKVPDSGETEVNLAVEAAKAAFKGWASKPVTERARLLTMVADALEARLDEFSEAESLDQGKPKWLADSLDVPRAVLNFRHFATSVTCDKDTAIYEPSVGALNYTVHTPVGVAAIIVPWNLPLYLLTYKLAPALIHGNTIVIKPSEFTSVTAFMLCEIFQDVGFPKGVVNVVFGYGHKAGEVLIKHPDVPLISFTGSTTTGCHIAEATGKMAKKLSLEMGGKNAAVVFDDADLEKCIPYLIRGSFVNSGQVCLSTSRIYIQRNIFQRFTDMFLEETKHLKTGNPQDSVFMGPVCSKQHFEKVQSYLKLAEKEGAKVLFGNDVKLDLPAKFQKGYFIKPTVITGLPDNSRCMQEEIFGPVTCLMPFDSEEEVIERVNGTNYGLCASLWSTNIKRIHDIGPKLEVGTIWCNCWLLRNLHMPFGGTKLSGIGRESTEDSRDFYTTKKTICVKYD